MDFPNPIWVSGKISRDTFFRDFTLRFSSLLQATKPGDQITLFINSGGGETHTALGIYDLLISSVRSVVGVVAGAAQSGASLILQACSWRIMSQHSTLLLHKSKVTVSGSVENAQEALNVFARLDEKIYKIYAERSGKKLECTTPSILLHSLYLILVFCRTLQ